MLFYPWVAYLHFAYKMRSYIMYNILNFIKKITLGFDWSEAIRRSKILHREPRSMVALLCLCRFLTNAIWILYNICIGWIQKFRQNGNKINRKKTKLNRFARSARCISVLTLLMFRCNLNLLTTTTCTTTCTAAFTAAFTATFLVFQFINPLLPST